MRLHVFRGRRGAALVAAMATSLFLATLGLSYPVGASAGVSVAPSADSYVDSTYPTTNFGKATQVRVDGSPAARSYLSFDLRSVAGPVTSATLRLYANSAAPAGYSVVSSGGGWVETSITFGNAPAVSSTAVGSVGPFAAGTTTSVNVTSAVKAGSMVNLAIVDRNSTAISFGSRESAHPPVLSVTTGSTATATASAGSGSGATATPPASAPAASAPTSDPVLIGAGDICITSIIGNAAATAKVIEAHPTAHVYTLGDNSNESGTASQYTGCYAKTWGPFLNRTRATIGNHDCMTSGCAPYYSYFGAAAGPVNKGYYSYNLANNWHIVVLNTQGTQIGGTGTGSPEEVWLRTDLAANKGKHIIAMWHIPVFTSGQLYRTAYLPWWNDLYAAHADLILNGHDHLYERFGLQSPAAKADPNGIREIIAGTGGASPQTFSTTIAANSQVRHAGSFGVLMLTLHAHSYGWQWIPIAGGTFTDSGTQATHS
jgi:hypothetical protein